MRQQELQAHMREHGIAACLFLSNTPNFTYLARQEFTGAVVVPDKGKQLLYASRLDSPRGRVRSWRKGSLFSTISKDFHGHIGIDKDSMTLRQHASFHKAFNQQGTNVSPVLSELRAAKTDEEIDAITQACRVSQSIIDSCVSRIRSMRSEREFLRCLQRETIERDRVLAFPPVVASGGNASVPHHQADAASLRSGFCVIDFGVKHGTYCADLTRTVFLGSPTRADRERYAKVQTVQDEAFEMCMEGVPCSSLMRLAQQRLGKELSHSLGHGVGIEVHEAPVLSAQNNASLKAGNVVTLEPGAYSPRRYGVRIEDVVLVGKTKSRLLSRPDELVTV